MIPAAAKAVTRRKVFGALAAGTGLLGLSTRHAARAAATITPAQGQTDWFNVMAAPYSAKGDGITDDTLALQNAITDAISAAHVPAHASHGGTVYLPAGVFLISSPLAVQGNNVTIRGCGQGVTVIRMAPGFASTYAVSAAIIAAGTVILRDFTIAGQGLAAAPAANAIEVLYRDSYIEDVMVSGVNGWGVELLNKTISGGDANNSDGSWINVTGNAAGGFHFSGAGGTNTGMSLIRCGINAGVATGPNANRDAFFAEANANDLTVVGFVGAIMAGSGALIHYAANGLTAGNNLAPGFFVNCDVGSAGPVVLIEDGTTGYGAVHSLWFTNCTLQGGQVAAVQITGHSNRIRFVGCQVVNSQQSGAVVSGEASGIEFTACSFGDGRGNGIGATATPGYDIDWASTGSGHVSHCNSWTAVEPPGEAGVQANIHDPNHRLIVGDCDFGAGSPVFAPGALPKIVRDCPGYNPVGAVTVPVPASGSATVVLASDALFYVTAAGSPCTVTVSGGPLVTVPAGACVPVLVPAGQALTPTYPAGAAPAWVVHEL